jgi:hypothetical protein
VAVVGCPVCGALVNGAATGCPECGADILAALASGSARPVIEPSWPWAWRLLSVPVALLAPVWLMAASAVAFAHERDAYYALPLAARQGDGDPFPADAPMIWAGLGVAVGVIFALLALSVALPRRLWVWWGIAVACLFLGFATLFVVEIGTMAFAYFCLPALVALRLFWQQRADAGRVRPAAGEHHG